MSLPFHKKHHWLSTISAIGLPVLFGIIRQWAYVAGMAALVALTTWIIRWAVAFSVFEACVTAIGLWTLVLLSHLALSMQTIQQAFRRYEAWEDLEEFDHEEDVEEIPLGRSAPASEAPRGKVIPMPLKRSSPSPETPKS